MDKFAANTIEMADHEGNVWGGGTSEEDIRPSDYGSVSLVDVEIGKRVRLLDKGRGPYGDDGMPVIERGGVLRHEYEAVLIGFEDVIIDDGLYEKHATVKLDSGKTRCVAITELGPSSINENGKRIKMANFDDCYWQAVGATIL